MLTITNPDKYPDHYMRAHPIRWMYLKEYLKTKLQCLHTARPTVTLLLQKGQKALL